MRKIVLMPSATVTHKYSVIHETKDSFIIINDAGKEGLISKQKVESKKELLKRIKKTIVLKEQRIEKLMAEVSDCKDYISKCNISLDVVEEIIE